MYFVTRNNDEEDSLGQFDTEQQLRDYLQRTRETEDVNTVMSSVSSDNTKSTTNDIIVRRNDGYSHIESPSLENLDRSPESLTSLVANNQGLLFDDNQQICDKKGRVIASSLTELTQQLKEAEILKQAKDDAEDDADAAAFDINWGGLPEWEEKASKKATEKTKQEPKPQAEAKSIPIEKNESTQDLWEKGTIFDKSDRDKAAEKVPVWNQYKKDSTATRLSSLIGAKNAKEDDDKEAKGEPVLGAISSRNRNKSKRSVIDDEDSAFEKERRSRITKNKPLRRILGSEKGAKSKHKKGQLSLPLGLGIKKMEDDAPKKKSLAKKGLAGFGVIIVMFFMFALAASSDNSSVFMNSMMQEQSEEEGNTEDNSSDSGAIDSGDVATVDDGTKLSATDASGVLTLSKRQMQNFKKVYNAAKAEGLSDKGMLINISTVYTESKGWNLANDGSHIGLKPDQNPAEIRKSMKHPQSDGLPSDHGMGHGGDHGSVGLYQQQVPWWGTVDELMIAENAVKSFNKKLKAFDYDSMTEWDAAQKVQGSFDASGGNYKKEINEAKAILEKLKSEE